MPVTAQMVPHMLGLLRTAARVRPTAMCAHVSDLASCMFCGCLTGQSLRTTKTIINAAPLVLLMCLSLAAIATASRTEGKRPPICLPVVLCLYPPFVRRQEH